MRHEGDLLQTFLPEAMDYFAKEIEAPPDNHKPPKEYISKWKNKRGRQGRGR